MGVRLMIRLSVGAAVIAAGAVAAFGPGCGAGSPTKPDDPSLVSPDRLARVYRDNPADRTYTNRTVQCYLPAKSYRVLPGRLEAHIVNPGRPGCVVFETAFVPPDNSTPLVVTGTCRGIIRDGAVREPGVDFFVRVESCAVTVTGP